MLRRHTAHCLVGGVKLLEHEHEGKYYVSMPFDDSTTYQVPFEEASGETQLWPVTPYEITARSEPSAPKCFVHLFVDGQKVDQHFLAPGTAVNFKGIPAEGGALKELLFSLPRFVTRAEKLRGMSGGTVCALDGEALSEVGTIKIVYKYVHDQGEQRMGTLGASSCDHGSGFVQANKQDVATKNYSASQSGGGGSTSLATTRPGKVIGCANNAQRGTAPRMNTYYTYTGEESTAVMHYNTDHQLRDLGVLEALEMHPTTSSGSSGSGGVMSNRKKRKIDAAAAAAAAEDAKKQAAGVKAEKGTAGNSDSANEGDELIDLS